MTREQLKSLIGQVLVCGFSGDSLDDQARTLIETHHVANIILFSRNVTSVPQVQKLNRDLQSLAASSGQPLPLLICTDQENGLVRRLSQDVPGLPGNMAVGASHDAGLSLETGRVTGRLLAALGINMDLAPVLDINNNPQNPVIGVRSYGDDPQEVSVMGTAMLQGLREGHVIACAKHFPGHGDTMVDSHLDLPVLNHTLKRMQEVELVPFKAAIEAGVPALMTAHIVFEQLDSHFPATLSPAVLTGLLRGTLGFRGVITTDCLEMNAIAEGVGVGPGAVLALLAGADMVMVSHHLDLQEEAIRAIEEAVDQGELPLPRLEEAASRIAQLKRAMAGAEGPELFEPAREEAQALQVRGSREALTLLSDRGASWSQPQSVALVVDGPGPRMMAAGPAAGGTWQTVQEFLAGSQVRLFSVPGPFDEPWIQSADWLVLVTAGQGQPDARVLNLVGGHPHSAVLLTHTPYGMEQYAQAQRVYALYENTPWMIRAALAALTGRGQSLGSLPVAVGPYPRGYRA